ncbi:hypothetical protein C1646_771944 [Rhizophagus diaphanus]|nr:hypothetical protein C1646_771944 [Rhizophagus diaphanus] [Rhizophagus sp. MUCL 43196]
MYCKRLKNFQSHHQDSHPTCKKQHSRFERACQSDKCDPSHNLTTDDHLITTDSTQTEGSSTKPPTQTRSKEGHTWHENLEILIPNDLLPYVTEDPVYINKTQERKKGKHYPPGHKQWFEAIKIRKFYHERSIAREQYEKELSARAKLWGTSTNSIEYREGMVKDLTKFQEYYHEKISKLTDNVKRTQSRVTTKDGKQLEHATQ